MSEGQDPGGGTLDSHNPFGSGGSSSGFGGTTPIGKDHHHHFSPTSTSNGHGLCDLSNEPQLTLLKSSGNGGFTSFSDSDGLSRLSSDGYNMEMRYISLGLGEWDLAGYTAEGLSARLIDSRSLTDSPDNIIQYRPWEKPDPSLMGSPMSTSGAQPVTTSSPSCGNGHSQILALSATSNGKSPTTLTTLTNAFPAFNDSFITAAAPKLPSFQSQFNSFNEPMHHSHHGDIHPVTTSSGGGATASSLPSFHTLPANRGYVHHGPNPPTLIATQGQPQFIDERHIQIFPGQIIAATQVTNPHAHPSSVANGAGHHHFVTSNQLVMNSGPQLQGTPSGPTHFLTGSGSNPTQQLVELVPLNHMQLQGHYSTPQGHAKLGPQPTTDGNLPSLTLNDLHHSTHHHSSSNLNLNVPPQTTKYLTNDGHLETLIVKLPPGGSYDPNPHLHSHHLHHHTNLIKMESQSSPQLVNSSGPVLNGNTNCGLTIPSPAAPIPKKSQKRKRVTHDGVMDPNFSSNNNSSHNHHYSNNISHDLNEPQVSSVSSTDSDFKRPPSLGSGLSSSSGMDHSGIHNTSLDPNGLEKPVKKKRKRCGECTGCQRKDNCGDCAPCRNEKSHQICKVRRCEKLTEKKSRANRVATTGSGMK